MNKKITRALIVLILVPLLAVAAVYGFLQTTGGHRWLAEYLTKEISDPDMQIHIEGLEGHLPFVVEARRISATDKDGEWLTIDALKLRWGIDGIWPLRWRIDYLSTNSLHLLRLPVQTQTKPKKPLTIPHLPRLRIGQLALPDIRIEPEVVGKNYQFAAEIVTDGDAATMQLHTLAGPQTTLRLDARQEEEKLAFQLNGEEAAGGVMAGLLQLSTQGTLSLQASGAISDSKGLGEIHAEMRQSGGVIAQASFSGNEAGEVAYHIALPDLAALKAEPGKAELDGVISDITASPALRGTGVVALEKAAPVQLDYRVAQQGEEWKIEHFTLRQDAAQADISGRVNPVASTLALEVQLRSEAAEKLVSAARGKWDGQAVIAGPFNAVEMNLRAQGELSAALGGRPAELEAKGNMRDWHRISVPSALLRTENERLEAAAEIDTHTQAITVQITLQITDVSLLAPALKGNAQVKLHAGGSFSAADGMLEAAVTSQGKTLALASALRWQGDMLRLPALKGGIAGIDLNGVLQVNMKRQLAEGALQLRADNLAALQPFLTAPVAGAGTMDIKMSTLNGKQAVAANASFRNARMLDAQANAFHLTANVDNASALSGLHAQLDAKQMAVGASALDSFALRLDEQRFTVDAKRAGSLPLLLHSEGAYALALPDWSVTLEQLRGSVDKQAYALRSVASVWQEKNTLSLRGFRLSLGAGDLAVDGAFSPARVTADFSTERLPLNLLSDGMYAGWINGKGSISGTPASPQLAAEWQADVANESAVAPAHLSGSIAVANGMANAQAQAEQEGMNMQAQAKLPVTFSFQPLRMAVSDAAPLQGKLAMDGKLDALAALALPPGQTLRGIAKGAFDLSGTLYAPQLNGDMQLRGGTYENTASGTSIQAITADISAQGNKLTLRNASATDGRSGTLTLDGYATLANPYPLSLSLALHEARLLNSSEVSGVVDGALKLQGDVSASRLSGALTLGPLDVQLPDTRGVDIPQVRVMNPEVLPGFAEVAKAEPMHNGESVQLDVSVSAPSRVFVRGRGLETEVRGKLKLTGTLAQPQIDGRLHTERGRYTLLDKELAITDGQLIFEGPMPPSPFIQMSAETSTKEITAGVQITGPVRAPELTLTSTPPLPQDEILAHLLFGRELRSITPFQAVQLAQAVQNLRGSSGASRFDLLTSARKLLGVDRLTVGGDGKDVSVGAGKYLTDRVYVGVEGGATPDAGKVDAEVELNRHFSVETEAGARTSGARLNWKYDY